MIPELWSPEFFVSYFGVGLISGLRLSVIMAWRRQGPHATEMRWLEYPEPFFTLLGMIPGWPLALPVAFGWKYLAAPPKEYRKLAKENKLKELEKEIDRELGYE